MGEQTRDGTGLSHHEPVEVSKLIPRESYIEARRTNGLAETVWDDGGQETILIYAPHGGDIEFGTDDAAIRLHNTLTDAGYTCSLWTLHGFGPSLFSRWHASKPSLTSGCYPGLDQVSDRTYDVVVSFHVQSKPYTAVGGQINDSIREAIASEMDDRIKDRYQFRSAHDDMRWKGLSDTNLVNKLSDSGGIQIEMQPIIGYKYRKKAVESVVAVLEDTLLS